MAVFDRHYAVKHERPLYGKVGGAIAVGAGGGGGQCIAICTIYNWMRSCGMAGVPGELNGVTAVALKEGEILTQEKRLRQARILGKNVLHFAEKIRGVHYLAPDARSSLRIVSNRLYPPYTSIIFPRIRTAL